MKLGKNNTEGRDTQIIIKYVLEDAISEKRIRMTPAIDYVNLELLKFIWQTGKERKQKNLSMNNNRENFRKSASTQYLSLILRYMTEKSIGKKEKCANVLPKAFHKMRIYVK